MYLLTGLLLISAALWLMQPARSAVNRKRRLSGAVLLVATLLVAALLVATLLAFGLLSVWGEWLWLRALGLEMRFWLFLGALSASLATGGLLAMLPCRLITSPLDNRRVRYAALLAAGLVGAVWGAGSWSELLVFLYRVPPGMREPVFGLDTGFFLFTLPFLDELYRLLLCVVLVVGAAAGFSLFACKQGPGRKEIETTFVSPEKGLLGLRKPRPLYRVQHFPIGRSVKQFRIPPDLAGGQCFLRCIGKRGQYAPNPAKNWPGQKVASEASHGIYYPSAAGRIFTNPHPGTS